MQSPGSDAAAPRRRSARTLWVLLAVCAAPIVASYVAFYWWTPSSRVNYGELLEPRMMPDAPLERLDGGIFRFSELKGEWLLLVADSAQCDERCRLSSPTCARSGSRRAGKPTRIERVWMIIDNAMPRPELLAEHPGLNVVHATRESLEILWPPVGSVADHIFVVDPLGHLMMRFPPNPDPSRMLKDLSRLLRQSRWK